MSSQASLPQSVVGLDVGAQRVGVAVASLTARLPRPLVTLTYDDVLFEKLQAIVNDENVAILVVGFPRGLQGQRTAQTQAIEDFSEELRSHVDVPIVFQDEAVTSRQAEEELRARGKDYSKADIDALAATYILEDYLTENKEIPA